MRHISLRCRKCGVPMVCKGIVEVSKDELSVHYQCENCNYGVEVVFTEVGEG